MSGQQDTSPDAGQKNLIGQQSGSNSSVRKLLLLIYKSGVHWWDKIQPLKDCHDSYSNHIPNHIALCMGKQREHSAAVGALAPVFEKLAIELKHIPKQKLLRCKSTIHIATLNIRTLNRIGQLPELTATVAEHNIDIVCIQEHTMIHLSQHQHRKILSMLSLEG